MSSAGERSSLRAGFVAPLVAMALVTGGSVAAQIYQWDDAQGRHFVDSLEAVPEQAREKARVVVEGGPTPGPERELAASVAPAAADAAVGANEAASAEESSDLFASGWEAGFRAGWDAGYRTGVETTQPVCPTEPAPVVLQSQPPVIFDAPRYDPSGVYYVPPYQGTVSAPFDEGRSMGLTRRMQIQEEQRRLQGR